MNTLTNSDIDVVYPESDREFEAYLKQDEARQSQIDRLKLLVADAKCEGDNARARKDKLASKLRELGIDPDAV